MVRNELFKAGIRSETRRNPIADALGVDGLELWVEDEQDFSQATELYAELKGGASGKPGIAPASPQVEVPEPAGDAAEPATEETPPPQGDASNADSSEPILNDAFANLDNPQGDASSTDACEADEPGCEELRQASSFLEKGIEAMFRRERELMEECGSLKAKVEELAQALAQEQATVAREAESRTIAEKNQAEQISGLLSALERERQEWEQQLKSRDELLQETQGKLDSASRLLQTQQASDAALREEIVSLEMQREEYEKSLAEARAEAATEQEARLAAEERAEQAVLAQESLQKQLTHHKELEQQMTAYVASLSSLCGRMGGRRPPMAEQAAGNGHGTPAMA